jgi:ribonuclease P protein component
MPVGASTRLTLGASQRLKQARDFFRLKAGGRRLARGCLLLNWGETPPQGRSRLGVVASKGIGNAVVRARAKRLLREVFRLHQHELRAPSDVVLVARNSIANKAFADVDRDFLSALRAAGLLQP